MTSEDLIELIDSQIDATGVSCLAVTDGHVFTFTKELLARLLDRAQESGRVVVFVQKGVAS